MVKWNNLRSSNIFKSLSAKSWSSALIIKNSNYYRTCPLFHILKAFLCLRSQYFKIFCQFVGEYIYMTHVFQRRQLRQDSHRIPKWRWINGRGVAILSVTFPLVTRESGPKWSLQWMLLCGQKAESEWPATKGLSFFSSWALTFLM